MFIKFSQLYFRRGSLLFLVASYRQQIIYNAVVVWLESVQLTFATSDSSWQIFCVVSTKVQLFFFNECAWKASIVSKFKWRFKVKFMKKIIEAAASVAILKPNFKMIRSMTDCHFLCLKSIEFHVLVVLKEFSFFINNSKV